MEHRAEINRFAIFLFCLLVPLGSLAPTGQRQKRFVTELKPLAAVLKKRATTLFEHYKNCTSAMLPDRSKERDMVEKIPECPAFHANCCALHHIYSILETVKCDIKSLCVPDSHKEVDASLIQLRDTLNEGAATYTCRSQDLPQVYPRQEQPLSLADKSIYIWQVLEKYQRIMQKTIQLYSEAAV